MDSFFLILRVAVSLAAVLGLIWFINRRWSGRSSSATPHAVTMVGRQALGQKSSVAVVDIDDHRYVLGVAEQHVTLLERYPTPEPPVPVLPPGAAIGTTAQGRGSSVSRSFEQKLRAAVALAQGRPVREQAQLGDQTQFHSQTQLRGQDPTR